MNSLESKVQAFKQLLGVNILPTTGSEAYSLSQQFANIILHTSRPSPQLEQVTASYEHQYTSPQLQQRPYRQHFIDLTTGFRLRYLEWPFAGNDVILLLHGIARCAESWIDLASRLSDRGYTVFALDLRGHGGTEASSSGNYSASHLAADVKAFITAKDLYIRPVAVVGCGIGAAAALTLAAIAPPLVGAVVCLDFGLSSDAVPHLNTMSSEVMPWWSFWMGQGGRYASTADCAAFLMRPMANIGPVVLPALLSSPPSSPPSSEAAHSPEGVDEKRRILNELTRAPDATARDAATMLRPSSSFTDFSQLKELKMDPKFFFTFNVGAFKKGVEGLKAHLLVVHGDKSSMVSAEDAATLAALARGSAASTTVVTIPRTGHHLLTDAPNEVYAAVVAFLEGPAVLCFEVGEECASVSGVDVDGSGRVDCCSLKSSRRPEALGLRPLPEYASLEEAQKALGPRNIPSAAAIEEELRKLRIEGGSTGASSDDDDMDKGEEGGGKRKKNSTSLARDSADYFGFVG